jgi:hypothetical protein
VEEMTKTPEELQKIAEEYERSITPAIEDADSIFKHERIRSFQYGYRADYQAAAPQWISVKDRLPEYENDYLLAFRIKDFRDRLIEVDRFWFGHRGWDVPNSYEVLAWMPLPAAPREEV